MTPDERQRFETLERMVREIHAVTDVPFIENAKRRIAEPFLGDFISKDGTDNTSGVLKTVDENGVLTYSVAAEYDGTIIVEDAEGNTYKIGYYDV